MNENYWSYVPAQELGQAAKQFRKNECFLIFYPAVPRMAFLVDFGSRESLARMPSGSEKLGRLDFWVLPHAKFSRFRTNFFECNPGPRAPHPPHTVAQLDTCLFDKQEHTFR